MIVFFDKTLRELFNFPNNIRLYIYTPKNSSSFEALPDSSIKKYIDKRATKPYYIWRLAGVKSMLIWRKVVKKLKSDPRHFDNIIRGFFAGEGNIKTGAHNNRAIRIAQGKENQFIEEILKHFRIRFNYSIRERAYSITHRNNWNRCAQLKIADLHPDKKQAFWTSYNSYKQTHYKRGYLLNSIYYYLIIPETKANLAKLFERSEARIYDVLEELKNSNEINNFRIRNTQYWIRNDSVLISKGNVKYLEKLKKTGVTEEIAREFKERQRKTLRGLRQLYNAGLVTLTEHNTWRLQNTYKKVIMI